MKFGSFGRRGSVRLIGVLGVVAAVATAVFVANGSAKPQAKYVIGVSNTLVGNGWREEMICAVKAQALASGKVSKVMAGTVNMYQEVEVTPDVDFARLSEVLVVVAPSPAPDPDSGAHRPPTPVRGLSVYR